MSDFQARNNNELVAVLGNFINRVFVLCHKYWDGCIPKQNTIEKIDFDLICELKAKPKEIGNLIENYKFRFALQRVMDLARLGNKYLADTEPWKLFKEDGGKMRTETILNISIQLITTLAIVSEPFMPFTSQKIKDMLNTNFHDWKYAGKADNINPNHQIKKPSLLFSRIEDSEIENQINKLKQN